MSTQINTTSVRIESAKRKITQRLFKNNIPGGNRNPIDTLGFNGLTINVKGYARTPEDYDTVVSEIFSAPFKLYLKDDWYYNGILSDFNVPTLDSLNYYPFDMKVECEEPYMYSDTETIRSKTITSNNQEWSADDDGFGIVTNGNVKAVPDIKVTAGAGSGYGGEGETDEQTDPGGESIVGGYVLMGTLTHPAVEGKALKFTYSKYFHHGSSTLDGGQSYHTIKVTVQSDTYESGVETTIRETVYQNSVNSPATHTHVEDVTIPHNEDLVVRIYLNDGGNHSLNAECSSLVTRTVEQLLVILDDIQVYNTADTTVKCNVTNLIHPDTVVRINTDGTGTYQYEDDFSDNKFYFDTYNYIAAVFNTNKADISNSGYIEYLFDFKYPITGIPTFTSHIDITAGTPTIKIAEDNSGVSGTYYDIDTALVDDVSTEYELDNAANLTLKGATKFWLRIDCDASATCSVKALQLDTDIVTVDVTIPSVNVGSANTFRCDQSSDSSLACTVELIYRDRKWT